VKLLPGPDDLVAGVYVLAISEEHVVGLAEVVTDLNGGLGVSR
jgi:hypothetical protein